jgi:ABC-type amino acid transport substrate-binding protein
VVLLEAFISYEPYAFMVRRGDANFRLAVDRVLTRLYRSAEVVPIYEKWFGPFPEGTNMMAALYVLNSVPE